MPKRPFSLPEKIAAVAPVQTSVLPVRTDGALHRNCMIPRPPCVERTEYDN